MTTDWWSGGSRALAPAPPPQPSGWSIARRLTAMLAVTSIGTIALFAALTLYFAGTDLNQVTQRQESNLVDSLAVGLGQAYGERGAWVAPLLQPVLAVASQRQLEVRLTDSDGKAVGSVEPANGDLKALGPPVTVPISYQNQTVGTASVRFGRAGVGGTVSTLRRQITKTVWISAIGAVLLALLSGLVVARRLTGPISRLTTAARSMAAGERGVRVSGDPRTKEFAELSRAFNGLAGSLERQEDLRRRLVADVAHELRTPVAVLRAWLESMVDDVVEVNKESLSSLLDETVRLSKIVTDLEVLSSADVEQLTLELAPVDLSAVAAEAALVLEPRIHEAGLVLERRLQPVTIEGDGVRLHQVVSNLLTNAIKFTPKGGTITLTVAGDGRHARLTVADTGVGIPADEVPHIFKRFWRGQRSIGRPGSGIGLSVVAELVRAHGGEITVTNNSGQGSKFFVSLPVSEPNGNLHTVSTPSSQSLHSDLTK